MRCKIYAPALAAGQFLDASVKAVSADEKYLACACANVPFVPDWLGLKRAYFAVDRASKLAVALPLKQLLDLAPDWPGWITNHERGNMALARLATAAPDLPVLAVAGDDASGDFRALVTLVLADYPTRQHERALATFAKATNLRVVFPAMKRANKRLLDFSDKTMVVCAGPAVLVKALAVLAPAYVNCVTTGEGPLHPGRYQNHKVKNSRPFSISAMMIGADASEQAAELAKTYGPNLVLVQGRVPLQLAGVVPYDRYGTVFVNVGKGEATLVSTRVESRVRGLELAGGAWRVAGTPVQSSLTLGNLSSFVSETTCSLDLPFGRGHDKDAAYHNMLVKVARCDWAASAFPLFAKGSRIGLFKQSFMKLAAGKSLVAERLQEDPVPVLRKRNNGDADYVEQNLLAPPRRDRNVATAAVGEENDSSVEDFLARARAEQAQSLRYAVKQGATVAEQLRTLLATMPGAYANGWRVDLGELSDALPSAYGNVLAETMNKLPLSVPLTNEQLKKGTVYIGGKPWSIGKLLQLMRSPFNMAEIGGPLEKAAAAAGVALTGQAEKSRKGRFLDKLKRPASPLVMWALAAVRGGYNVAELYGGGESLDLVPQVCGQEVAVAVVGGEVLFFSPQEWAEVGSPASIDELDTPYAAIGFDLLKSVATGGRFEASTFAEVVDDPVAFAAGLTEEVKLAWAFLDALVAPVETTLRQQGKDTDKVFSLTMQTVLNDLYGCLHQRDEYDREFADATYEFESWEENMVAWRMTAQRIRAEYERFRREAEAEVEEYEREYAAWEEDHAAWEDAYAAWKDSEDPDAEEPEEPEEPEPWSFTDKDDIYDFDDWLRNDTVYNEADTLEPLPPDFPAFVPDPNNVTFAALCKQVLSDVGDRLVSTISAKASGAAFTYKPLSEKDFAEAETQLRVWAEQRKPVHLFVSCHPRDVLAQSEGRFWRSCKALDGQNSHFLPADLTRGVLVGYFAAADDRNLERPFGRVLINPYTDEEYSSLHGLQVTWRAASAVYGMGVKRSVQLANFVAALNAAAQQQLGTSPYEGETRAPGLYADGAADTTQAREDSDAEASAVVVDSYDYGKDASQWSQDFTGKVVAPLAVVNVPGLVTSNLPTNRQSGMPYLSMIRVARVENVKFGDDYWVDSFDELVKATGSIAMLGLKNGRPLYLERCDLDARLDEQEHDSRTNLLLNRSRIKLSGSAYAGTLVLAGNGSQAFVMGAMQELVCDGVDTIYDPDADDSHVTGLSVREAKVVVRTAVPALLRTCDVFSARYLEGTFYEPLALPKGVKEALANNARVKLVPILPEAYSAIYYQCD